MKNLFIPFELAFIAKEKGFNEPCLAYYYKDGTFYNDYDVNTEPPHKTRDFILAPIYQQIVDWFREKHRIEIHCTNYYKISKTYKPEYECRVNGKQLSHPQQGHALGSVELYPSYYEAVNRAIEEAFKLI